MFWKYNSLTASHLDTLLDKQGVTLAEILEQEDIIQECKTQNKKLVDYLTKPEILSELLDLILQEPPVDLEESLRFKLPNIASELITCDVPQINEKLSSDTSLLDKMYAFLEGPPPLNPLLTSFFSKAFGVLITRRSEQNWYSYQYTCLQVIEYIKVKEGFTGLLLTHIATSAVMDLVLRLITCVDGTENKQNILTWLNDERLIQRVLSLLAPPGDGGGGEKVEGADQARVEQHDNVGQLLVEIIRVSRDSHITATPTERFHNPLLATAESMDTVHQLLGYMLDGPAVESTIVNGVDVLLSLLEIRRPAPQGGGFYSYTTDQDQTPNQAEIDRQQAVLESTVECIIPRLPQLTALLLSPPPKPPIRTTCGVLEPPLGRTRLSLAKPVSVTTRTQEAFTCTRAVDGAQHIPSAEGHGTANSCVKSALAGTDIGTGAASKQSDFDVTFADKPGQTGVQFLLEVNINYQGDGAFPVSRGVLGAGATVKVFEKWVANDGSSGARDTLSELAECSDRGLDNGDGECECFDGFRGLACEEQEALV